MTDTKPAESILAADCGSVFTKAILIDKIDGRSRLAAVGEALTTPGDVSEGLAEAVRDIEVKTGRKLLNGSHLIMPEYPQGYGVDAAVLACSAGRPVGVMALGISPSQSLSDATRVADVAMADLLASISLPDIRHQRSGQQKMAGLQQKKVDAVLFVAGPNGGENPLLPELCEFVARSNLVGTNGDKLPVVFAGTSDSFAAVGKLLGSITDLLAVEPISTPTGAYHVEPAASRLNDLYLKKSILNLPGLGSLTHDNWSAVAASPTAGRIVASFLAMQSATDVLMIDLGATVTTVSSVRNGQSRMAVVTNCGMGPGIRGTLAEAEPEEVLKWLPFEAEANHVWEVGLNKGLRPHTVPQLAEELFIEEAIARTTIRRAIGDYQLKSGMLIASGGFFPRLPRDGRIALLLLDAVQPHGITPIYYDARGVLPSLGALAMAFPVAAGEVITWYGLQPLCTAVSLVGSGKQGQVATVVGIQYDDGSEGQVEVNYGDIEAISLPAGRTAKLQFQPAPKFQLGDNPRGQRVDVVVNGSSLGIVIDARGRPLNLPSDPQQRIGRISNWNMALDHITDGTH